MTADEKKEIKQAVLDEIKAESNDITEIETVSTLDGLTGLPAMQGGKLVTAPLSLLSKPATDAAATANAAAGTANKAADTANKAAQTATNAAATANKAASMISTYDDRINLAMNGASARFDGFVEGVIIEYLSVMSIDGVYYDIKNKRFCAKKDGHYYNNWVIGDNTHAASMYLDDGRKTPRKDKIYVCGTNLYVWDDKEDDLVVVDKTTKAKLDALASTLASETTDGLMSKATYNTLATQVVRIGEISEDVQRHGTYINTLQTIQGDIQHDVSTIQNNITDINGKLGEPFNRLMRRFRAVPNCETIEQFNNWLDVSLMDENNQGVCVVPVYGIPMLVVTAQISQEKNVWMQTLFGCVSVAKGRMSIDGAGGKRSSYVQLVRYANNQTPNTGWGEWWGINPSAQTAVAGTNKNYVYSQGKSEDTKTLVTSKFWIYQHGDGNMYLRFKHYGAANDTKETDFSQVQIPNAWIGANGLLRRDIYSRIDSFALREQNSTATEVKIVTPIFTTGGTRELSISQATTAKAGVMTAADKAQLDVIAASIDSFCNSITEQAKRIYDLEQCKPLATKRRNGFMSSEDKTQLQGAYADFNARQQANDVEGYVGRSNVISVPGTVENTQIAADLYRNAEERDYTPGASFDVYVSAGYDENNPNKQCVWFGSLIEPTTFVRYRLDYWLHGTADTLVGKYLCDTSDKYYEVREGAVGEYISEALDDTPCIMTIADRRLLNQIKQKLGL